ncbi:hypothetical protein SLE2022_200730 [Rubroshorea leprosula]
MVTNALIHVEDCLKYTSALQDPAIFRFGASSLIMHIGLLALFSNNIEIFRGRVKMRRGLAAEVIDRTKTMADVYGALFDFSCVLKAKIDKNDPSATETLSKVEAIQKACWYPGVLNRTKSYITQSEHNSTPILVSFGFCIPSFV